MRISKAKPLRGDAAEKIRSLQQKDIPITQRRSLYNSLARKMKSGVGLKPGLVQKYQSCITSKKDRFELLKEFLIDPQMSIPQFHELFISPKNFEVRYQTSKSLAHP